jgi:hypothetical protein
MNTCRSVYTLSAVGAIAVLTACSSVNARGRGGYVDPNYTAVNAQWDSGPLDESYRQERLTTDTRHNQELANATADEHDQVVARQTAESQDLEKRYQQGKDSHAKAMPQADTKDHSNDQPEKPDKQ